jgi:hypothetical protein
MNRKTITIVIIIVLVVGLFFFLKKRPLDTNTLSVLENNNSAEALQLPSGWQVLSSSDKTYKLEKSGDYQIKPQIVTSITSLPATQSGQNYIDLLISGAKSTLPGLKYSVNSKESSDNLITRKLVGSYYSGKNKVNVYQRITIQGETITTLTASCIADSCSEAEVKPIFDTLVSRLAN